MSLPEERPSFEEPLSSIERMQSGLAGWFVTPSLRKNDGDGNHLPMMNLSSTRGSHQAQQLQKVF
jgi:hypothetical protein